MKLPTSLTPGSSLPLPSYSEAKLLQVGRWPSFSGIVLMSPKFQIHLCAVLTCCLVWIRMNLRLSMDRIDTESICPFPISRGGRGRLNGSFCNSLLLGKGLKMSLKGRDDFIMMVLDSLLGDTW